MRTTPFTNSLQSTVYSLQSTVYSLQSTVYSLLLICFLSTSLVAQVEIIENKSYTDRIDSAFAPLFNNPVPYNRLYDRVFPWAALDLTTSGDTISFSRFKQSWLEVELSTIPTASPAPSIVTEYDKIKDTAYINSLRNQVEVSAIITKMSSIDTLAFSDGRLDEGETGWYHVEGEPSPYDSYDVTMASISVEEFTKGIPYTFRLKPDHILHNDRTSLQSIQLIEPQNGINVTLTPGQETTLTMIDTGSFYMTIKTNFWGGSSYTNTQEIKSEPRTETRDACNRTKIIVESQIPFQGPDEDIGTTSLADAYIYYHFDENGECEKEIKKPIIICDGYDPQDDREINEIEDLFRFNGESRYAIKDLRELGFDVIIMNFPVMGDTVINNRSEVRTENGSLVDVAGRDGGSDFTQRNAFLMVELIQMINDSLDYYNSNEQLCIIGPSMGGQITRYALAYMEMEDANNVPNMYHNTRLWVSYDSPHLGANIPIGNTAFLESIAYDLNLGSMKEKFNKKVNTPAAQQYLINQTISREESNSGFTELHQSNLAPRRQLYLNALQSNGLEGSGGWPTLVRRVAITNSSDDGTNNGTPGEPAFNISKVGNRLLPFNFSFSFVSTLQDDFLKYNSPLYKISFSTTIMYMISLEWRYSESLLSMNSQGSMDVLPGSKTNSSEEIYSKIMEIARWTRSDHDVLILKPDHTFIPAISALAFNDNNVNWGQQLNNRDLVCTEEIPFDSYYLSGTNDDHITVTEGIYNFIEFEVLNGVPDCDRLCGPYSLSGLDKICDGNTNTVHTYTINGAVESGHNITWLVSGDMTEVSRTGNSIDVKISNPVGSAEINAVIENDCGKKVSLKKSINIGIPTVYLTATQINGLCKYTVAQKSTPSGITANKYEWSFSGSHYTQGSKSTEVLILPQHGGIRTVYGKAYWGCGLTENNIIINDPECSFAQVSSQSDKKLSKNNEVLRTNIPNKEILSQDDWILFPNPAEDGWFINKPEYYSGTIQISVTNLNGKLLFNKSWNKLDEPVFIKNKNMNSGVYMIHINTTDALITLKAIKQ